VLEPRILVLILAAASVSLLVLDAWAIPWVAGCTAITVGTALTLANLRRLRSGGRTDDAGRTPPESGASQMVAAALRQSNERLELALWGAELGLWDWHIPSGAVEANAQLAHLIGLTPAEFVPVITVWNQHTHPDDLPLTTAAMTDVIEGRAEDVDVEFRVRHAAGGWRWNYARGRAVERDATGRAIRLIGITRDITARREAEESLRGREALLQRRIDELVTLNQIAQALSSWTNLGEGLAAVAHLLLRLFGVATVTIWEHDVASGQLAALKPDDNPRAARTLWAADLGPAGLEELTTLRLAGGHPLLGGSGEPADRRLALLVPLRSRNVAIGLLCLGAHGPDNAFAPEAIALAQTVGSLLANAVENARLFAAAQVAAAERERRAIARELHDSVSQALYAANVAAETVPLIWELDPDEGRERLYELRHFTQAALSEMRTLLVELRPRTLVDAPLHETLGLLVPAVRTRGVEVVTTFEPVPLLPPTVQVALYRIAQEAVNNASRHAHATRLNMALAISPLATVDAALAVTVTVADNGRGFDLEASPAGHMGLTMMRERAAEIGAQLAVASSLGAGTTVNVRWRGAGG
jgi:PAS domain S-box-containing protein